MIKIFGREIPEPKEKNEITLKFEDIINNNKIVVDEKSKNIKIFIEHSDYSLVDASGDKKHIKKVSYVIPKEYLKNILMTDESVSVIIQIDDKEYGFKITCEDLDNYIFDESEHENTEKLGLLGDEDITTTDEETHEDDTLTMTVIPKQIPKLGIVLSITNIENNKSKSISITSNEPVKIRLKNENKYKLKIKRRFIGIPKELTFTARPGVSFSVEGFGFTVIVKIS